MARELAIETDDEEDGGTSTIKAEVPEDLHLKAHARKIVEGVDIRETVTEALRQFFDEDHDDDGST